MSSVLLIPDQEFKVGKIVCVGQNYTLHIEELNSKRSKDPLIFLKPSTAIVHVGEKIQLPTISNEVHHETELALLVGKKAKNVLKQEWKDYISGVGIALDLTLRDLQREAKKNGHPWTICKGFDYSCPISTFIPLDDIRDIQKLDIELYVNKELKQKGYTGDMIWTVGEILAFITGIFTLEKGDIILTGTPAGVGPIHAGDHLKATISEIGIIEFELH
jgi:5-carboxymethyl-2-hydroxymuconate isomerase